MKPARPVEAQHLQQAFQVFNLASSELCAAYEELRGQAEALTRELALANGELEHQLAEKQALSQRFVLLLEALPGGVVVLDDAGSVVQANPAAYRMVGAPLIGFSWPSLALERLRHTEVAGEWLCAARSASAIRLSIARRVLQSGAGEVLLIQDITEAHAQRECAQRKERLAAMGEMAARLAHRLRTPLATALLYAAQMGGAGLPAAKRACFADKTVDRLQHLERLIEDMLLFVRGAAGSREPVSPAQLLREVVRIIEPQAREQGLRLEFSDEIGALTVSADPQALRSALISLAENAVQACAAGAHIRLVAAVCDRQLEFHVIDNGPGIPTEAQGRLFEPFFTTRSGGTGLGLAIVRAVAEAHGGNVAASSVPGAGSEFVLRLPLDPDPKELHEVAPAAHC